LSLEGVRKVFGEGPDARVALDGVELSVAGGEFVAIVGSNGAGKTTLLNVVAGRVLPDRGRVHLDDADITAWPDFRRAAQVATVFQDPRAGTAPDMTVEENLALAVRRGLRRGLGRGVTPQRRAEFAAALAPLGLGLESRLRARVGDLSGGERQALTLLMATVGRPRVLLLDEHTAALDPRTAVIIRELTDRIVSSGRMTTLMVTHDLQQAVDTGNRLIMLHRGAVVLDIAGREKQRLTVPELFRRFQRARGEAVTDERLVLG